jgi:Zn-dependent protease
MVRPAGTSGRKRKELALEFESIAIHVLVLVFSVVVHENAHGWAAKRLGDPTAHDLGRITMNPIPHIDPIGSIVVPIVLTLFGGLPFGWAKPVPVNPGRLNDPNNDYPKVAAAGPLSNLILAMFFAIGLGVAFGLGSSGGGGPSPSRFFITLCQTGVLLNVVLAMFNLIPIPPLDGSWILSRYLPREARARYENLRRYGMLMVMGIIMLRHNTPLGGVMDAGLHAVLSPYFDLARNVANALS